MSKPMYCPMSFNNVNYTLAGDIGLRVCIPDCAWADNDGVNYWCGIKPWDIHAKNNTRPLKDDVD